MCCVRTSGDWFHAFFAYEPVAAVQGCYNGGVTGRERRMSCVCSSSGAGSCIILLFLLLPGSAAHLSLSPSPRAFDFHLRAVIKRVAHLLYPLLPKDQKFWSMFLSPRCFELAWEDKAQQPAQAFSHFDALARLYNTVRNR